MADATRRREAQHHVERPLSFVVSVGRIRRRRLDGRLRSAIVVTDDAVEAAEFGRIKTASLFEE